MAKKSTAAIMSEHDLSFLFPEFFTVFSMNGTDFFMPQPESIAVPSNEDYLQKGERLLTLAREKFKKVVGKIQLSDAEEKIFASTYAETDSFYDLASKIARIFTRPLLKAVTQLDDDYAMKLIKEVSMPSLKVRFEAVDMERDATYLVHIKRKFAKYKKTDANIVKLILEEDGFYPMVIFGALNHTHPESLKSNVYESGSCLADLGLLTAYLIIYKQLMTAFKSLRNEDSGCDALAESLLERAQTYEKQFIQYYFTIWPSTSEPLLEHFSLKEILTHPIHMVGIQKGYVPPFVADYLAEHGVDYIDHPSYDACYRTLGRFKDPSDIQFRFASGETQLCFTYMLQEQIPFHYLLTQFTRKEVIYWTPLPNSKSNHSGKAMESHSMCYLADLFRIVASHKHSQNQMLTYYRDLEKSYAKSYMLKKSITQKTQKAMEQSSFNDYFGFVEFDVDTDLEKVEEIAREFRAVKETYFPSVESKANAIRFRKLGQHKALGLYYPSLACLCVDIHSPSSLIHEFGHLIDYCYGNLSEQADFKAVRKRYIDELDKALDKDEALQKRMKSGSKYNRSYYTMPTEIFARCFELYVSKCLGVKNSIVPATFSQEGIYPTNDLMLDAISNYFGSRPFVKAAPGQQRLKCADA